MIAMSYQVLFVVYLDLALVAQFSQTVTVNLRKNVFELVDTCFGFENRCALYIGLNCIVYLYSFQVTSLIILSLNGLQIIDDMVCYLWWNEFMKSYKNISVH